MSRSLQDPVKAHASNLQHLAKMR